jgi:hypothetical protein
MQTTASEQLSEFCEVIVFPAYMGTPASSAPPPGQQPPWNPHWYGNLAQWIAPLITLLIGIIMVFLQVHYRNVDSAAKSSDEHTNSLIDAKLTPPVREINASVTSIIGDIGKLDTRIKNLEKAVQTLADNQSKETQKIIKRLLDAAANSSPTTSAKLLNTAASLIVVARNEQIPAEGDFFRNVSDKLGRINKDNNPELQTASFSMQYDLAEYRSSLIPVPSFINITVNCESILGAEAYQVRNPKILATTISDGAVANCFQQLDGAAWINMTFINSDIFYSGGAIVLKNVKFIHCKFETYQSEAGFGLLQYAASDKMEFEYPRKNHKSPGL